ncbi:Tripartite motif-containing protein 65 [Marasmius sp. AFHP31]|nr:Tripartite motif-containing protein 65 [Marasmius sp. AFHP31]
MPAIPSPKLFRAQARAEAAPYVTPPTSPEKRATGVRVEPEDENPKLPPNMEVFLKVGSKMMVQEKLSRNELQTEWLGEQRRSGSCPICSRVYLSAWTMDCGHDVCGRCLERSEDEQTQGVDWKGTPPRCPLPECQQPIVFGACRNTVLEKVTELVRQELELEKPEKDYVFWPSNILVDYKFRQEYKKAQEGEVGPPAIKD